MACLVKSPLNRLEFVIAIEQGLPQSPHRCGNLNAI